MTEDQIQQAIKQLYGTACVSLRTAATQQDRDESERLCMAAEELLQAWGWSIELVYK